MTQSDKFKNTKEVEVRQVLTPVASRKVYEVGTTTDSTHAETTKHWHPKPPKTRKVVKNFPKHSKTLESKTNTDNAAPIASETTRLRKRNSRSKTIILKPAAKKITFESVARCNSWRSKLFLTNINKQLKDFTERLTKGVPFYHAQLLDDFEITRVRAYANINSHEASITFKPFTQPQMRKVIEIFSEQAIYATQLLNGELPEEILQAFSQAGMQILPEKWKDYTFTCDCKSEYSICEHIAALILQVAQSFDENPYSLLLMRGVEQESLFEALRRTRSGQTVEEKQKFRNNYEMPICNIDFSTYYQPKGSLDDFEFNISVQPNKIFQRLGEMPIWNAEDSIESVISSFAHQVAELSTIIAYEPLPEVEEPEIELKENEEGIKSEKQPRREKTPKKNFKKTKKQPSQTSNNLENEDTQPTTLNPSETSNTNGNEIEEQNENIPINPNLKPVSDSDLFGANGWEGIPVIPIPFSEDTMDLIPEAIFISNTIIWAIRCHGAATTRQLARRTRMKKNVVAHLLQCMLAQNLVSQEGIGEHAKYSTVEDAIHQLE